MAAQLLADILPIDLLEKRTLYETKKEKHRNEAK